MTSFHSKREAIEFYQKEYPHIHKSFIELAIDYDILEQQRITDDIERIKILQAKKDAHSDAEIRNSKMKDRLRKKLELKNLSIEQKGCHPEVIEFT